MEENKLTVQSEQQNDQPMGLQNFPSAQQIGEYETFLNNYDKFVGSMLKKDTDYGEITGVAKPTLLKPGAEKLEKLFFLRSEKECIEKEVAPDYSFVKYTYRTTVRNKSGQIVSTCEGTCNSKEKKYRSVTIPANKATAEQKQKGRIETRSGQYGEYQVVTIDKPDFYDMENTIMKMAQKRSYVGAILEATNSSGRFTQDVEDMNPEDLGQSPKPKQVQIHAQPSQPIQAPQSYRMNNPEAPATEPQRKKVFAMIKQLGKTKEEVEKMVGPIENLTKEKASKLIEFLISKQSNQTTSMPVVQVEDESLIGDEELFPDDNG